MTHKMNQSRGLFAGIGVAMATLLACSPAGAQSFTGSITGTVTDPSGAVAPGVKVTVTQLETNRTVTATTRADGVYLATALPVGDYRVDGQAPGFKRAVHTGIKLEMNQTAVIAIALEIGTTTERVEVVGDAALDNFDLSLFKEFHPAGEWMKMQLRAEALNAFNRVQFSNPNTSVTSSSLGRVAAQANTPRQVQFGLKLLW